MRNRSVQKRTAPFPFSHCFSCAFDRFAINSSQKNVARLVVACFTAGVQYRTAPILHTFYFTGLFLNIWTLWYTYVLAPPSISRPAVHDVVRVDWLRHWGPNPKATRQGRVRPYRRFAVFARNAFTPVRHRSSKGHANVFFLPFFYFFFCVCY
jgi:hypothetical protein